MFWVGLLITVGFLITAGIVGAIAGPPSAVPAMLALAAPLIGGGTAARIGTNPMRSSVFAVALGVLISFAALFWASVLFAHGSADPYEREQLVFIMLGYLIYCTLVAGFVGWLRARDLRRESSALH